MVRGAETVVKAKPAGGEVTGDPIVGVGVVDRPRNTLASAAADEHQKQVIVVVDLSTESQNEYFGRALGVEPKAIGGGP